MIIIIRRQQLVWYFRRTSGREEWKYLQVDGSG